MIGERRKPRRIPRLGIQPGYVYSIGGVQFRVSGTRRAVLVFSRDDWHKVGEPVRISGKAS